MNGKQEAMQGCLLRLLHKIIRYSMRDRVCQADHRGDALPSKKTDLSEFCKKFVVIFYDYDTKCA